MTSFYQGTLQEGIAAAVRDTKAVTCFVRDDEDLSSTWEETYFGDDEVAQALNTKAIVLRLMAGSQEAGFLTPFCPISKFPTVVVINNGALKEYIGPDIPKDEFRNRLRAALESETIPSSVPQTQGNDTPEVSAAPAAPAPAPQAHPKAQSGASKPAQQQTSQATIKKQNQPANASSKNVKPAGPASSTSQSRPAPKDINKDKGKAPMGSKKPIDKPTGKNTIPNEQQEPKSVVPRGPPTQYRLQVRLFDGRSVRSSFTPTQSIKNDVRPWLDLQMEDDNRPYSLKQIRNPLPSETLSVSQESQTLRDLGIGSTANLVMIPVSTYTEAYSAAGSLPARGISALYNMASSAATTATGLVGSFLGYGSTTPAADPAPSAPESTSTTQRPRQSGPNIRTLRDQQDGRGNSQLYNGNQLNFEPRKNQDKDK